jgi:16S rRNA (adenine1518-N6/adenine1519-N6)-dimethyltransferase
MSTSIPALMRAYGLRPRKDLGQNFLADPVALGRIVDAADLTSEDTVLEVGAGLGTLTRLLAERAGRVVAVELDARLTEILQSQFSSLSNVQIVQGDVLALPDLGLAHLAYKVVGNLPYYITSAVLRHFLEGEPCPCLMVVTVQREVAERIVARPGEMSLLAVSVQFYSRPRIVARIPAGAFYPPPQVDSAVLRLDVERQPTVALAPEIDERTFFRTVRAGFAQKRKTLRNALSAGLGITAGQVEERLTGIGIDPRRRAQTLSLEEWAEIALALQAD